jgi:hypothetical protein
MFILLGHRAYTAHAKVGSIYLSRSDEDSNTVGETVNAAERYGGQN